MSLRTLKRRVEKLEPIGAGNALHVIVVGSGSEELDTAASELIAVGNLYAREVGKKLEIIKLCPPQTSICDAA